MSCVTDLDSTPVPRREDLLDVTDSEVEEVELVEVVLLRSAHPREGDLPEASTSVPISSVHRLGKLNTKTYELSLLQNIDENYRDMLLMKADHVTAAEHYNLGDG